jgi:hypothetical protein
MLQTCDQRRLLRERRVHHLDRHATIQFGIMRGVHYTHAAAADLLFQPIAHAAQVGTFHHLAQMPQDGIAQLHTRRSSTSARSRPRAHAR